MELLIVTQHFWFNLTFYIFTQPNINVTIQTHVKSNDKNSERFVKNCGDKRHLVWTLIVQKALSFLVR